MRYIFLAVIVSVLFITSCNVINPAEDVPTYVYLDSINFKINEPLKEGSASQKITSAWVYFNNDLVGAFELPCRVPVLGINGGTVRVAPGVTYAGLSQENQYAFFEGDTFTIAPTEVGKVVHHVPTVTYTSETKFPFKEDFETGNSFQSLTDLETDTTIVRTDDKANVFEGGGSGYIVVDASHPTSENISNKGFPIKQGSAFVELNYKCNTSFQVGLITNYNGALIPQYLGGVKAREGWNKIYIDLSTFTSSYPTTQYFLIIKTGLDDGLTNGYVLLDNIKVLTY
ncbi:MAG: hypothetical protein EOP51_03770 [Sphingobacteriales bacterium]|nr:MAG: hypothetical protein EOP51_03770 [Sphingobacteriales bacterium]